MFGLKPDVIMRTKENPCMEIDWETFDSLNRTELQIKSVKDIVDVSTIYCLSISPATKISLNLVFQLRTKYYIYLIFKIFPSMFISPFKQIMTTRKTKQYQKSNFKTQISCKLKFVQLIFV